MRLARRKGELASELDWDSGSGYYVLEVVAVVVFAQGPAFDHKLVGELPRQHERRRRDVIVVHKLTVTFCEYRQVGGGGGGGWVLDASRRVRGGYHRRCRRPRPDHMCRANSRTSRRRHLRCSEGAVALFDTDFWVCDLCAGALRGRGWW